MTRLFAVALLFVHGLLHLPGAAVGFKLTRLDSLPDVSRTRAWLWLGTSALFGIAAAALQESREPWFLFALAGVFLSQALILRTWNAARYGTVVNVLVLVLVAPSLARLLPNSLTNQHRAAVRDVLSEAPATRVLREDDLAGLPPPVQKYLRTTGSVGQPIVFNVSVRFTGQIRNGASSPWMPMRVEQHNSFSKSSRAFHMEASVFGFPIEGLHLFEGPNARMDIRLGSIVPVARASGPEMNQSETVTIFNDMWLLAPSTLLDSAIVWERHDATSVVAAFTRNGITVRARIRFNEAGELIDFESDDRYQTAGDGSYVKLRWSTPISGYRDFGGRRIWTEGQAVWDMPNGPFCYGKFTLESIAYNVAAGRD